MSTPSVLAYGTTIGYATAGSGAGGTYTTLLYVKDLDPKKIKRKKLDTTNLTSPASTDECTAGQVQPEAMKLKVLYLKAQHATLQGLAVNASPLKDWKITLSDGSTGIFTGYISEFDEIPKASLDECYMTDLQIQPTTPILWTPGT